MRSCAFSETHSFLAPLVSVGAVEDVIDTPRLSKDGAKDEREGNTSNPQSKLHKHAHTHTHTQTNII